MQTSERQSAYSSFDPASTRTAMKVSQSARGDEGATGQGRPCVRPTGPEMRSSPAEKRTTCLKHRLLEHTLQLADVSGPGIRPQDRPALRSDDRYRPVEFASESTQVVVGEQIQVLAALTQRREAGESRTR